MTSISNVHKAINTWDRLMCMQQDERTGNLSCIFDYQYCIRKNTVFYTCILYSPMLYGRYIALIIIIIISVLPKGRSFTASGET